MGLTWKKAACIVDLDGDAAEFMNEEIDDKIKELTDEKEVITSAMLVRCPLFKCQCFFTIWPRKRKVEHQYLVVKTSNDVYWSFEKNAQRLIIQNQEELNHKNNRFTIVHVYIFR